MADPARPAAARALRAMRGRRPERRGSGAPQRRVPSPRPAADCTSSARSATSGATPHQATWEKSYGPCSPHGAHRLTPALIPWPETGTGQAASGCRERRNDDREGGGRGGSRERAGSCNQGRLGERNAGGVDIMPASSAADDTLIPADDTGSGQWCNPVESLRLSTGRRSRSHRVRARLPDVASGNPPLAPQPACAQPSYRRFPGGCGGLGADEESIQNERAEAPLLDRAQRPGRRR